MKDKAIASLLVCFLNALSCSPQSGDRNIFSNGQWIDLTHIFSPETIYWPTAREFTHDTVFAGMTEKNYFYSAYNFSAAEHGGTHIDAPVHFVKGQKSVDEIPLTQLIGPAVVIDVSGSALQDHDYLVSVDDFRDWELQYGTLRKNVIVLLYTGYGQFWPDRIKYMGTDKRGAEGVAELHFPGLDPEAARWLVKNRKINAIGLDTPSIDYGQSQLYESHQILFKAGIPVFENVANLERLPATGAQVLAFPMNIKGGSGGPLRIAAFVAGE